MKIAILGTGISGMVTAYLLARDHDITVFEAEDSLGGHSHTVKVPLEGKTYPVDTGFIVYNEKNYPNFTKLLKKLGVQTQASNMSFSVSCPSTGFEYGGAAIEALIAQSRSPFRFSFYQNLYHFFETIYAQKGNLLRPAFHRMGFDILRFAFQAREFLHHQDDSITLGDYLRENGYSREFQDYYVVPMGAAIWSTDPDKFLDFPAAYFLRFLDNHGLISLLHVPQWRTICGGSVEYVKKLTAPYAKRIRLKTPVRSIKRHPQSVSVRLKSGRVENFDHVVIATHSDQALALLEDPTKDERNILGAIPYQPNNTVLHSDENLLPRKKLLRSSWNYHFSNPGSGVALTYNMNILQRLAAPKTFCVTLNHDDRIDSRTIWERKIYHHPLYVKAGVLAQKRHAEISGIHRTHYCGAYWGYGFHEDGVKSALAVGRYFGKEL